MPKDKKSKINKIEELRKILDDPNDPEIKKLKPKDSENLELIRRKLIARMPSKKDYEKSSESFVKKYDKLKSKTDVSKIEKRSSIPETTKIVPTKQAIHIEKKPIDRDTRDDEDLYEIEKIDYSEPEFLEVITKEPTKPIHEKEAISEKLLPIDKKDEMVIFKKIKSFDEIQIYHPISIFEMWIFTVTISIVAISGLFLMRDWLFLNFGVYGEKLIPTPPGFQNIHIWFGFVVAIFGLMHLGIHVFSKQKDILPKQTLRDFKAFLHSATYLINFTRKEDFGTSDRFNGRQRIVYLALVYILGLTILTGFLYFNDILSTDLSIVHVIPAGLSIIVLLFHFLITLRNHDKIALKGAFVSGKLPLWYVRKNHPIWYEKIMKRRDSTINTIPHFINSRFNFLFSKNMNNTSNAILKFSLLFNDSPDIEQIEKIAHKIQATTQPEILKRIIEFAEQLDDETIEENKEESSEINDKNKVNSTEAKNEK